MSGDLGSYPQSMTGVLVGTGIAVFALLVAAIAIRRAARQRRILGSVATAAGVESTDVELVKAVRELSIRSTDSRLAADAYLAAIEGATTGIVMLSSAGVVAYANKAAERYIDDSGDWAILRTRVASLAKQALASRQLELVEVDMHDPARLVLLLTAVPIPGGAEAEMAVTVYVEDLSARRRVDAMRSDFVTNASHELKTPIGALSLLAETLAFTDDPEKRAILAEQLASEASRMTKVVDDILTLARTESMTTEYVPVDVVAVLDEVASGLSSLASSQDISLVRGPMVRATVNGDVVELSSAFRNLLLNAITYTNAKGGWGGSVTYRSSIVDDRVCIEVEDTGVGFPARYERRVFERFFRVDHSRGRQSGGTGLGLSIVKNVAVAHGGTVMAKSEVGVGSVFTICLPVMGSES